MTLSAVLGIFVLLLWTHADTASGQQAPTSVTASATSPTSIDVSWELPAGATADEFIISYSFAIRQCVEGGMQQVMITAVNGALRRYTISDSSTTPVEEDSVYTITVSTVSNGTTSDPSNTSVTTGEAAPGMPQSLRVQSANVTNITIQWDRVDCQQRNGQTDSYVVVYFPTATPTSRNRVARTVAGVGDNDRMFTVTGLPPRTSYTFQVQANNPSPSITTSETANLTVSTSTPQNFGFILDGRLYPNNSVVTLSDIGSTTSRTSGPLYCLTPSMDCCSVSETPNADTVREWYLPDGSLLSTGGTAFTRGQVSSAVILNRGRSGESPTGVFRCDLPDASGTSQSVYVGIYSDAEGSPSITSVLFDRNSTTLTCTSTGGPPTTVTWMKDGVPVNESVYQQSQRVVHTENATYENVLFNDNVANFVGTFTCGVSNVRRTVQENIELNGVSITRSGFPVGGRSMATCTSDTLASRMEWLTNGVVVASAMSTQTLELIIPLVNDSIHNDVFICRVTREDGRMVTQNFTVIVDVPPDSVTAVVSRSGTARAGMVYNLTCTVSKVDGLVNSPTASWITSIGMVPVSSGNGITVATSSDGASAVSTLTFDLLRTSHNDAYMCVGSLNSPALQMPLTAAAEEELTVQISTPDITVSVPAGPLYAGQEDAVILTCSISLNSATDTGVEFSLSDVSWLNGTDSLSSSDPRVTISLDNSQRPFTSTLSLFPLSTFDTTNITCRARVRPRAGERGFVNASQNGDMATSIPVNTPPSPTVQITQSSASPIAGEPLTLNCLAAVQEGIMGIPTLAWSKNDINVPGEAGSGSLRLPFTSISTSDGGNYTCTTRLLLPESGLDLMGTNAITLVVQIPVPSITITTTPDNSTFYEGVVLSITCLVELHPSVNSPVSVRGRWLYNGTQLQNSSSDNGLMFTNDFTSAPAYTINISFCPVTFADSGVYSCGANVTPQNSLFISEPSRLATDQLTVNVQAFPSPIISVHSRQASTSDGCGVGNIVECTAVVVPGLVSTPVISWISPNGSQVSTGNLSDPAVNPNTSRLVFRDVNTANSGQYKCLAAVGEDIDAFASINISNSVPGKVRNLVCARSSSPTELSFSWELPTELGDEVVDYRVEVKELRHRPNSRVVEEFDIDGYNTEMMEVTVNQGLAAEVPYSISVKALNVAGCGPEQQIYCFTQEGVPPTPENVAVAMSNSTSIRICWRQFTLVELKGLAQYNITYRKAMGETEMNRILIPWTQNCATVDNLQPGVAYAISISTSSQTQTSSQVSLQANTLAPPAGTQNDKTLIIIGVVIAVLVAAIVLIAVIVIVIYIRRRNRRSAEMKFERTRMLRAFEAPMVGKPERYSLDVSQALSQNEKNDLTNENKAVDSEPVDDPATIPVTTFTQPADSTAKPATDSSGLATDGTDKVA